MNKKLRNIFCLGSTSILISCFACAAFATVILTKPVTTTPLPNNNVTIPQKNMNMVVLPSLAQFTIAPDTVYGGTQAYYTVTLDRPAPASGVLVMLANGSPDVVIMPTSITVPNGQTGATGILSTNLIQDNSRTIPVNASYNNVSKGANVYVYKYGTAYNASVGKYFYNANCANCHNYGLMGAPKIGDKAAWAIRIAEGMSMLVSHATKGYTGKKGMMPANGGNANLSERQVGDAVAYIVQQSK